MYRILWTAKFLAVRSRIPSASGYPFSNQFRPSWVTAATMTKGNHFGLLSGVGELPSGGSHEGAECLESRDRRPPPAPEPHFFQGGRLEFELPYKPVGTRPVLFRKLRRK
jgi:hypothetical protein